MKDSLNIVVVGHVDHGKSTVLGRLLYDTDALPLGTIEKVKKIAHDTGKPFEYAYLLDAFEEEQKQGITIDITQIQFSTAKRDYTIIDAPGHKEFLKNMISGAANAKAALLVVDAKEGVQEQSKRHGYMLSLLGIRKIYVLINKMDLVDYDEKIYQKVAEDMKNFLLPLGVTPLDYIPVSGLNGDNIANKSQNIGWYKGNSLIEALDLLEGDENLSQKSLRFPIQDVYKFDERRIIAGRTEAGKIAVGDEIVIYPGGRKTKVAKIPYWQDRDKKDIVSAGESTGIQVSDEFFNNRGEIIVKSGDKPPLVTNRIKVSLFWMGKNPMRFGQKYKLKLATAESAAELLSIEKIIDSANLLKRDDKTEIRQNDVAEAVIALKDEIACDIFDECQATGRFVIADGYDVAGGGIVLGLPKEDNAMEKNMRYIMEHLPKNGELTIVMEDGKIQRLERVEKEIFSGLFGEGI